MEKKRYKDFVAEVLPEVEEIFPWDLADELKSASRPPLLLDIRCPHEFNAARIRGSINVPRGILEMACEWGYEETEPELAAAEALRIIVICRSGNRSVLAAHTLMQMGYRNPVSLKTGLRGWNDFEQPLEDATGRRLSLEEADDYFLPRLRPAQLGPAAGT